MDIRSILINVDLDTANSTPLHYAIDLAQTFDAELIGVAADLPNFLSGGLDGGAAALDFCQMERSEIETRLRKAEEAFHAIVPAGVKTQWRAFVTSPVAAVVETACAADVIVTGAEKTTTFQETEKVDLGEIVLTSGRPVLAVGTYISKATLDKVMIAWKDSREARRAVADALPFFKLAKEIVAVTVSEGDYGNERASLDDLATWLASHGVTLRTDVVNNPDKLANIIEITAVSHGIDLLVSGGYGHSRMREWLLGGVTRNLLSAKRLNRLFSN